MSSGPTPNARDLALKANYVATPPSGGMGLYCFNATETQLRADFTARGFSDVPGNLQMPDGLGGFRAMTCHEWLCFVGLCSNCGVSFDASKRGIM